MKMLKLFVDQEKTKITFRLKNKNPYFESAPFSEINYEIDPNSKNKETLIQKYSLPKIIDPEEDKV